MSVNAIAIKADQPGITYVTELREFVKALEQAGQLIRTQDKVLPEPELSQRCVAHRHSPAQQPALLFDNVTGYRGKRLLLNTLSSWRNCALMLGLPKTASVQEQLFELCRRWETGGGTVRRVENPPCQQNVLTEKVNLFELLPLFRINPLDGGYYLTKSLIVSNDMLNPTNSAIGMYPIQVQGPGVLGVHLCAVDQLAIHLNSAEKVSKPVPVAVCLGPPPLISLAAVAHKNFYQSFRLMASLMQSTLELARCVTVDVDVPARSEIVIEGFLLPGTRFPEGPVAQYPGAYTKIERQPRIKVTAVTYRTDPIMENMYVGESWTEYDCIAGLAASLGAYKLMREAIANIARMGGMANSFSIRMANQHAVNTIRDVPLERRVSAFPNIAEIKQQSNYEQSAHEKCPRCAGKMIGVVARSPDGSNAWAIYLCSHCAYSWRTTESEDLPPSFSLEGVRIDGLSIVVASALPNVGGK